MIQLRLSLFVFCGLMPVTALASPDTAQAILDDAPYTLRLDTACSSTISIQGTPDQKEAVTLDRQDTGLTFTSSGHDATLQGERCDTGPTLHVRPGTAIIARMRGYGSLNISGVNGPVSLNESGSTNITIDQATALDLNMHGFGSLKLGWLNGPGKLILAGSGNSIIARVDSPSLSARVDGFGGIDLSAGSIGALDAHVHGAGHIAFGGTARTADLTASGYGGISVNEVTGEIHQDAQSPASISLRHGGGKPSHHSATRPILTLPDGTIVTAHNLIRPDGSVTTFDDDDGDTADVSPSGHGRKWVWRIGLLVILLVAFRRRLTALLPRGMRAATAMPDNTPSDHPDLVALQARLQRLDQRVGHVEHCVTSRDFHLHREFQHLARRHG